MQKVTLELHDIKPLQEIEPEFSWFDLALLGSGIVVACLLIALLWYLWRRKNKPNLRKAYYEVLKEIKWEDSKSAAYTLTHYGHYFIEDSPRIKEAYVHLVERLSAYKYKKEVGEVDEETRAYYANFIGMIDV